MKVRKRIYSPRLDLDLRVEKKSLRLLEPGSSRRLRTYAEAETAAREAEQACRAAGLRAIKAEQEDLKRRLKES